MNLAFSTKEKFKILINEYLIKLLTLNYFAIKKVIKQELEIKKGEKLLDVGCGTGILSKMFSQGNYTGIDIDKKLIEFCKNAYNNNFLVMSVENLRFPLNTFDKIIIIGVIHHLNDRIAKKAFLEIKKVLKKNGQILLIEAIPPISKFNIFGKVLREHDKGEFVRKPHEYEKLFTSQFKITKKYKQKGGIVDYAVFLLKYQ